VSDFTEAVARVCHEANRALCAAFGDLSQPSWEQAPEWQRTSAIKGVQFHLDNPNAGPEASHSAWMADKLAAGWTWGSTKDPDAKKHPCLVPFHELPPEQQAKDHIFRAIVHAHAKPSPCSIHFDEGKDDEAGQITVAVRFFPDIKIEGGQMKPTPAQFYGSELAHHMMDAMRSREGSDD